MVARTDPDELLGRGSVERNDGLVGLDLAGLEINADGGTESLGTACVDVERASRRICPVGDKRDDLAVAVGGRSTRLGGHGISITAAGRGPRRGHVLAPLRDPRHHRPRAVVDGRWVLELGPVDRSVNRAVVRCRCGPVVKAHVLFPVAERHGRNRCALDGLDVLVDGGELGLNMIEQGLQRLDGDGGRFDGRFWNRNRDVNS